MDAILFVDTLINVLIAICALLAAVAVVFLVVRPLLDPHWKDGRASSDRAEAGEGRGEIGTHGMQGM